MDTNHRREGRPTRLIALLGLVAVMGPDHVVGVCSVGRQGGFTSVLPAESRKAQVSWKKLDEPTKAQIQGLRKRYSGKPRFLVDESIGTGVVKGFQSRGYNAQHVSELGLQGRSDEDVFAVAWSQNRVIVTHDPDFLDDRRFPPHRNPGIVVVVETISVS